MNPAPPQPQPPTTPAPLDDCWNRIGIRGDRSCPELVRLIHCTHCPVYAAGGKSLLERPASRDYLEDWARLLAGHQKKGERIWAISRTLLRASIGGAAAGEEATDTESAFVFRLRSEWFAMPTTLLELVSEPRPVHAIPHRSNNVLLGLTNLQGGLHLCIAAAELLGLTELEPPEAADVQRPKRKFLLWAHDHERWVFSVDEIHGVHWYVGSNIKPLPATVSRKGVTFAKGLLAVREKEVTLLDHELLAYHLKKNIL